MRWGSAVQHEGTTRRGGGGAQNGGGYQYHQYHHHQQQQQQKQPCRYFMRGHCRFGNACKYSHDVPQAGGGGGPSSRTSTHATTSGRGDRNAGSSNDRYTYQRRSGGGGSGGRDLDMDDGVDGRDDGGMQWGSAAGRKVNRPSGSQQQQQRQDAFGAGSAFGAPMMTAPAMGGGGRPFGGGAPSPFGQPASHQQHGVQSPFGGGGAQQPFGGGGGGGGGFSGALPFGGTHQEHQRSPFGFNHGGHAAPQSPFKQNFRLQGAQPPEQQQQAQFGFGHQIQHSQQLGGAPSPMNAFGQQHAGGFASNGGFHQQQQQHPQQQQVCPAPSGPQAAAYSQQADGPQQESWSAAAFARRGIPEEPPPAVYCR